MRDVGSTVLTTPEGAFRINTTQYHHHRIPCQHVPMHTLAQGTVQLNRRSSQMPTLQYNIAVSRAENGRDSTLGCSLIFEQTNKPTKVIKYMSPFIAPSPTAWRGPNAPPTHHRNWKSGGKNVRASWDDDVYLGKRGLPWFWVNHMVVAEYVEM